MGQHNEADRLIFLHLPQKISDAMNEAEFAGGVFMDIEHN